MQALELIFLCVESFNEILHKSFKLQPLGQNWPHPGGHCLKIIFSELSKGRGKIFGMKHCEVDLSQDCSNYSPGVKLASPRGPLIFIMHIKAKLKKFLF
jgi:hypothetical protein